MGGYPWLEVVLFQILRVLVFYPTRHRLYRVAVLAAMFYTAARIYLTPEVTNPMMVTYLVGASTAFFLMFTTYLLCSEGSFPDHWRRARDGVLGESGAGGLDDSPSNFPLGKKLWWMLDIAYSPRMIGWLQEPRNLPSTPSPSRKTFLRETSLKLITNIVLIDLAISASSRGPAFDSHLSRDSTFRLLAAAPILRHAPYVLAFGVMTAVCLSAAHNFVALIFVGLGHCPTLWPDVWGNWGDAYTVRKLWGYVHSGTLRFPDPFTYTYVRRTWHQQMRPVRRIVPLMPF
jgi:hypothetical protein